MEDGGGAAPDGKSGWDPAAPVTPCDCPKWAEGSKTGPVCTCCFGRRKELGGALV